MPKYYEIDETAAMRAKEVNSYFDYTEGSATAAYRQEVDRAIAIAEQQKARVSSEYHARIDALLDSYARRLAENHNHRYRIDARVPSVLVSGPANFPVKAKARQNAARDNNEIEYREIQSILDKIRSCGMGGIMSDDPVALEKLQSKLTKLEKHQATMKAANAAIRMKNVLQGDGRLRELGFTQDEIKDLRTPDCLGRIGFPSYELTNNNANIRRIRERITSLKKEASMQINHSMDIEGNGYTLRENIALCRIQFMFDAKPNDDTRSLLKSHGFKWSPKEGALQRLLNDNARSAAVSIARIIDTMQSDAR